MLSNQDPEALSHQKQKPPEAQSTCEVENNNPEAKPSEQIILNTLPDEKEVSLWENANLILTENTKNLEIFYFTCRYTRRCSIIREQHCVLYGARLNSTT